MEKPFLPLMMGDWMLGTMGMKLDVKGAYIDLLIYQYAHGFVPESMEDLVRIVPDLSTVWVSIEVKFPVVAPGKRQNFKLEKVRAFWSKQSKNGSKGGRPSKDKPKHNPNNNPKLNHHNDTDLDTDLELKDQKRVPREVLQGTQHDEWETWGALIVNDMDPLWGHGDRSRKVTHQEMDVFLSVATRNAWTMDTQESFRRTLKGFDWKKGSNGATKTPVNMKNV